MIFEARENERERERERERKRGWQLYISYCLLLMLTKLFVTVHIDKWVHSPLIKHILCWSQTLSDGRIFSDLSYERYHLTTQNPLPKNFQLVWHGLQRMGGYFIRECGPTGDLLYLFHSFVSAWPDHLFIYLFI